jgi:hypothetical protein
MQLWFKPHGPRPGDLPALIVTRPETAVKTTAFELHSKNQCGLGDSSRVAPIAPRANYKRARSG